MTPENEPDRFAQRPDPFTGPAPPAGPPEPQQPLDHPEELQSEAIQNGPRGASEIPVTPAWQDRLLGISFAIFAFEIGLFLVIFPWMGDSWDLNYFQSMGPVLQNVWDEPYFRGAVSGLGFLNIYIATIQIARLFRRSS